MHKSVISKDQILNTCRKLVKEEGIQNVNMRKVASSADIALGSLYNYFPDKNALLTETVISVWNDIFRLQPPVQNESFLKYVDDLFQNTKHGIKEYRNFFTTHSLRFTNDNKSSAQQCMRSTFNELKEDLKLALDYDPNIRSDAFNETFKKEDVAELVYTQLMASVVLHSDCDNSLIEILTRILY